MDLSPEQSDELTHYGVKRRSGRYPWGSGENPYQHSGDFLSRVEALKSKGYSDKDIIKDLGFASSTEYRYAYSIATNERRKLNVDRAKSLKSDGLSTTEIGKKLGVNESTVRSWLNEDSEARMNAAEKASEVLKKEIKKKGAIDVGPGVERELGVSRNNLDKAIYLLELQGYNTYGVGIPTGPGKQTIVKALCAPTDDTKAQYRSLYQDTSKIKSVGEYHSTDGGFKWDKREYPASVSSNRVAVRYGDKGGSDKDGVIELRRGVADLNLGNSHYAQVRILVDGTHYLKGMAIYSDDIPDGADIVFNTNKKSGTPLIKGDEGVLKPIKSDPDNPFGAYIKADGQSYYTDKSGKKKLSAINKLKEEGDWDTMSRNLSSQFLSKQPMSLITKQLNLTYADNVSRFDEIKSNTNNAVRKKLLLDFANECDSAVVHLKAAALPRQESRVILPITALKDNEVYAPYLKNGEKVALIRYPHGGTFEIPELVVNNKNQSAKKILGNAIDAIGINSKVAERLSGADFDGDSVVVIPLSNKVRVKSTKALEELENFDPKVEYAYKEGIRVMSKKETGREMGMISNLITDMTLQGAPFPHIARAVKHSMVVIDAAKHKLDYKQSEKDQGIDELRKIYQPKYDDKGNVVGGGGASTLISKHKRTIQVPERKGSPRIDKETGEYVWKESGRTYVDKTGKRVSATQASYLLKETPDINTLSSGTPQEKAYADYANKMKSLANAARKEYISTPNLERSSSASKTYKTEVDSLMGKLDVALRNAPKERRAKALANSIVKAKIQEYPELSDKDNKKELNKVKRMAMDDARASVGASGKATRIDITDKEWEAIQAGALSHTKVTQVLRYADPERVAMLSMPKATTNLSTAKQTKIKTMNTSGYTIQQIAEALGVSTSTVSKYLKN